MELPISDITFPTLRKAKTNGYNSTTKESDNSTQEILRLTVLVVKIGEGKVKVLIFSSMKK
jgi:hypothetical protein